MAPQPPTAFPQPYRAQPSPPHPGQPYPYQGQPPQYPGQPAQYQGQPSRSAPPQYAAQSQPYQGQPQQAPQPQTASGGQDPSYGAPQQPTGNALGRIAFFAAAAAVALQLLSTLLYPLMLRTGDYEAAGVLSTVFVILVVLVSIAAVVLAVIALRRPAARILPSIALGAAGSTVAVYLVGALSSLF